MTAIEKVMKWIKQVTMTKKEKRKEEWLKNNPKITEILDRITEIKKYVSSEEDREEKLLGCYSECLDFLKKESEINE